jgi:hypothetical protein
MTKLVRFYLEKKINTKFRVTNETNRLYNNKNWLNKIINIISDKFHKFDDFEVYFERKIALTVFPELASKLHNKYCRL